MKGFTLVELICVVILIGVISLITIPIVVNMVDENSEKLYEDQINSIRLATEKWGYQNLDLLPSEGDEITITLLDLKRAGLIELNFRNPMTNDLFPNDMIITISSTNSEYAYTILEDSGTSVTDEFNINSPTIVLNGNNIEYNEINTPYNELGATAFKDDTSVAVNIQYKYNDTEIANINTSEYKTYTATYSATYNGYTSYIVRTVVVRDKTEPVITLPDTITITKEEALTFDVLDGVTVIDNSNETINLIVEGFDTNVGKHIVSYTGCDSNDNCSVKKRIINVE